MVCCVIIVCLVIFSRFDKYFPYYDYSEFYSKGFNSWDLELEYLSLVNTFDDLRLNNDAMSSNSISYDEFLSYKSETVMITLDEYLDFSDNFIQLINEDNSLSNDEESNGSDKFSESMDIYNISAYDPSRQLELDNWLALTS